MRIYKLHKAFKNADSLDQYEKIYSAIEAKAKKKSRIAKATNILSVIGPTISVLAILVFIFYGRYFESWELSPGDLLTVTKLPDVVSFSLTDLINPFVIFILACYLAPLWVYPVVSIIAMLFPAKAKSIRSVGTEEERAKLLAEKSSELYKKAGGADTFWMLMYWMAMNAVLCLGIAVFFVLAYIKALIVSDLLMVYLDNVILSVFAHLFIGFIIWGVLTGIFFGMGKVLGAFTGVDNLQYFLSGFKDSCDEVWLKYDSSEKARRKEKARREAEVFAREREEEARKKAEIDLWRYQKEREGYIYTPDGNGGYKFGPPSSSSSSSDSGAYGYPADLGPSYHPDLSKDPESYPPDPEAFPPSSDIW